MTKGKLNVRVIDREGHLELALVPWFTKRCPSNFLAEGFALLNLGDVEKVPWHDHQKYKWEPINRMLLLQKLVM